MAVLQRDQRRLRRPHHQRSPAASSPPATASHAPTAAARSGTRPRTPGHDDRAQHQDDADRGAITGVVRAQVEAADLAARAHLQQVAEQPALPAARTAAGQRDVQQSRAPAAPPGLSARRDRAGAAPVDADEQEQPDHVDEVPVPGGRLEAEMPLRRELIGAGAEPADDQEAGADDDVEAVEAGRQEEDRGIDAAADERERRVGILDRLAQGEARPSRMVRPSPETSIFLLPSSRA